MAGSFPCPTAVFGLAALAALALWALVPRTRTGPVLLAILLLATAFHASVRQTRDRSRRDTLLALQGVAAPIELRGTLVAEPDGSALPHGGARISFRFRADSMAIVSSGAAPQPLLPTSLPFLLDVDFYGPKSLLEEAGARAAPGPGEGWLLTGRLRSREAPYRTEPILSFRTTVDEPHVRLPGLDAPAWRRSLWRLRRETARRLTLGLSDRPHAAAVLRAVLLGYRTDIPEDVRDLFANSGTVHFFAISGLHIMLIASLLLGVLRCAGVPRRAHALLLVPALVAYTVLTGARPSAVRACVMTSLVCMAPLFRRRTDAISALAAAASVLLLGDPSQLQDLGFVFSFSSVFGILLLATPLATLLRAPFRRLPRGDGLPMDNLSVSIAAWAVSEPITARVFGQMVPISVLSNLLVIPIGEVTVSCAVIGLAVGCVSPLLEIPFNWIAAVLIDLMVWLTGLFTRLPGSHFDVPNWPIAAVAAWYAALLLLALVLHVAAARAGGGAEEGADGGHADHQRR